MKMVILFTFIVVICGIVGYLCYLYFEKKKKEKKEKFNKKATILSSIFTFIAIGIIVFFTSFTENYFYMLLIFITTIVSTSLILGLLLRWLRARENKNKEDVI